MVRPNGNQKSMASRLNEAARVTNFTTAATQHQAAGTIMPHVPPHVDALQRVHVGELPAPSWLIMGGATVIMPLGGAVAVATDGAQRRG